MDYGVRQIHVFASQCRIDFPLSKGNQASHGPHPKSERLHQEIPKANQNRSKQIIINDVFDCFKSKAYSEALLSGNFHFPILIIKFKCHI